MQTNIKETSIEVRIAGPFLGEFTGDRWIPPYKGQVTRKKASMWWRHIVHRHWDNHTIAPMPVTGALS